MSTAVFILPLVCAPSYKILDIAGSGLEDFSLFVLWSQMRRELWFTALNLWF